MTATAVAGEARAPRPMIGDDGRNAALMLTPAMTVLAAVAVFPIVYSFYLSLYDIKLTRPFRTPFVGVENYVELLQSPLFWSSVGRSVSFTLAAVGGVTILGLLVALLLNEDFRGRKIVSTIILIPWAIPYVADALMWKWIYDSGYGALNGLLFQIGLIKTYAVWLGDPDKTLWLIANAFVWKETPLAAILLLVTLNAIPADLYRAARVDGAGLWARFVHITLPSLRPGFVLVILYETMMAIRHFDLFFILTEGGPGKASHVLAWQVYVETFRNLAFGLGSALAYILALITFALAYVIIRTLGRRLS